MIYINTFLYYSIFCSVVLFYGIGLNQVSIAGESSAKQIIFFVKGIISIFTTAILSYLFSAFILIPLELVELCPLICFLIFVALNSFAEGLVRLTTGTATTEFVISFLIVLISIFQSNSILDTMVIALSCICAIFMLVPFIYVLRNRLVMNGYSYYEKYLCIFFLFMGVLVMLVSVFDVSWLNGGMIK